MCYTARVTQVGSRALRNELRSLLQRVEQGEDVTITVDGRPVAVLRPLAHSHLRWISRADFAAHVLPRQADHALAQELRALAPETTDSLPL
jgi:prevent-host-death family protein